MDVKLDGNTLRNGYFSGMVSGPSANSNSLIITSADSAVAVQATGPLPARCDQLGYDGAGR